MSWDTQALPHSPERSRRWQGRHPAIGCGVADVLPAQNRSSERFEPLIRAAARCRDHLSEPPPHRSHSGRPPRRVTGCGRRRLPQISVCSKISSASARQSVHIGLARVRRSAPVHRGAVADPFRNEECAFAGHLRRGKRRDRPAYADAGIAMAAGAPEAELCRKHDRSPSRRRAEPAREDNHCGDGPGAIEQRHDPPVSKRLGSRTSEEETTPCALKPPRSG